jgi:acetylornithine deacetylase/succinyl-diaminopimelate desuccinylase-like protein
MDNNGKHLALEIQAGEKLYQDFKLTITGPGGHSSRPLPNDVIHQMASAIDKIDSFRFPIRLLPVVRGTFEAMSKQARGPLGKALGAAAKPNPDPTALEILSRDSSYASMMRTTCVATMVTAGHAPNALAQRAEINVNCRILPGDKPNEIVARLKQVVANSNVVFAWVTPAGPVPNVPTLTPELMALVQKNADSVWAGIPLVPVISVGWTDGSLGNAAGLPTYGLSGIFHAPDGDGVHGLNERISVKSLYNARTFLYRVVKDLAN